MNGPNTSRLIERAIATLPPSVVHQEISLLVDGGPENNNTEVDALLQDLPVRKLIAGVQITCSNSMIEAVNKTLKYRYLYIKPIPDLDHVPEAVGEAIEDYCNRPHGALSGLSPNEAYAGKLFDWVAYHERIISAGVARRALNRSSCPPCLPPAGEKVEKHNAESQS